MSIVATSETQPLSPETASRLISQSEIAVRALDYLATLGTPAAGTTTALPTVDSLTEHFGKVYQALTQDSPLLHLPSGDAPDGTGMHPAFAGGEGQLTSRTAHLQAHATTIRNSLSALAEALGNLSAATDSESLATALQQAHSTLRDSGLQDAELVFGTFAVALSRQHPALFPNGLDFSRVEADAEGEAVFRQALDAAQESKRNAAYNARNDALEAAGASLKYASLPNDNVVEIAGLHFLTHHVEAAMFGSKEPYSGTCLVTANGYLAPLDETNRSLIEAAIREDRLHEQTLWVSRQHPHLSEFITTPNRPDSDPYLATRERETIEGIRQKVAALKDVNQMSGHPITPNQQDWMQVAPVCLEIDRLTGLSMARPDHQTQSEFERLQRYLKDYAGINRLADLLPDFALDDTPLSPKSSAEMHEFAFTTRRERVADSVQQAFERTETTHANMIGSNGPPDKAQILEQEDIKALMRKSKAQLTHMLTTVWMEADKAFFYEPEPGTFQKIEPPAEGATKHFLITQGGVGSGKASATTLADSLCGKGQYVEASLDASRSASRIYHLYQATDTHHEDYRQFHALGNAVRDLVVKRANTHGHHLLYDGSGIPYAGRYDQTVQSYKEKGYETTLYAAATPYYTHDPEHPTDYYDNALLRGGNRLTAERRTVPTHIAEQKHVDFPLAFLDALQDTRLDRIIIDDNSGPYGSSYPLAWVENRRKSAKTAASPENDPLAGLPEANRQILAEQKENSKATVVDNLQVDKTIIDNDELTRVLHISNPERYVTLLQKGLLHPNGEGPYRLYENHLPMDVGGTFRGKDYTLNLTPMRGISRLEVAQWQAMLQSSHNNAPSPN